MVQTSGRLRSWAQHLVWYGMVGCTPGGHRTLDVCHRTSVQHTRLLAVTRRLADWQRCSLSSSQVYRCLQLTQAAGCRPQQRTRGRTAGKGTEAGRSHLWGESWESPAQTTASCGSGHSHRASQLQTGDVQPVQQRHGQHCRKQSWRQCRVIPVREANHVDGRGNNCSKAAGEHQRSSPITAARLPRQKIVLSSNAAADSCRRCAAATAPAKQQPRPTNWQPCSGIRRLWRKKLNLLPATT